MPNSVKTAIKKIVQGKLGYIPQPDGRTCQSTAIGMVLGDKDIYGIRAKLESLGTPGSPDVMAAYLRPRVKDYQFEDAATLMDVRKYLDQGKQLITHGWFTRSGHVVKISGYEVDPTTLSYKLIVDDPWMEFNFKTGQYIPGSNGNDRPYSSYGMYAYCVASSSYWNATDIYKRGELDSKRPGMWLHVITL
ncbi:MAG TPA: hypothetical protein V6C57_26235 [Coleofasciculaceae cyanobacterium]